MEISRFAAWMEVVSSAVLATFAEPVELFLEGQAAPAVVRGIFVPAHQEVDVRTGVPVASVQPVLEVWAEHLPATPTEGDAVVVRGVRYTIVEVRPDGIGFLKLMLHKGGGDEAPAHVAP